jgi:AraC-like DNA-binding protein
MLENSIYLFSGLLGFIVFLLMVFRYKKNHNTNAYFLVLILLTSIRFIIHGFITIYPFLLNLQNQFDIAVNVFAWPLFYLYFYNLVYNPSHFIKSNLLHFVIPTLFISSIWFNDYLTKQDYNKVVFIGIVIIITTSILYVIASYKLLNNTVWTQKNELLRIDQKNKLFKQWTIILFVLFILMFLRFLFNFTLKCLGIDYFNKHQFLWFSALICIGLYLKMLQSPELIYGYHVFQKKIKEYKKNTIIYKNIWITNKPVISNIQDSILKEKIENNIENYILSFENLVINSNAFFTEKYNTTNLANELNIPKSHILYLFKYHSKIKFSEFKKIIRIQKTIRLIEEGYLKKNTMESLASEVGFTSYSSFFKSFLSITGVSPQEYLKK